jgi:hypothetical protein
MANVTGISRLSRKRQSVQNKSAADTGRDHNSEKIVSVAPGSPAVLTECHTNSITG